MNPLIDRELIEMYANLPSKLSVLSKFNPEKAVKILQDWGDGKKTLRKLWKETESALKEIKS